MRDGDTARYFGKGVTKAIEHVNTEICEAVLGLDATEQGLIDRTLIDLDGTPNKSRCRAPLRRRLPTNARCRFIAISAARARCSYRCRR